MKVSIIIECVPDELDDVLQDLQKAECSGGFEFLIVSADEQVQTLNIPLGSGEIVIHKFDKYSSRAERLNAVVGKARGGVLLFITYVQGEALVEVIGTHLAAHKSQGEHIFCSASPVASALFLPAFLKLKSGFHLASDSHVSFRRRLLTTFNESFGPGLDTLLFVEWARRMGELGIPLVSAPSSFHRDIFQSKEHKRSLGKELLNYFQHQPGTSSEMFGCDIGTPGRIEEIASGERDALEGDNDGTAFRGEVFYDFSCALRESPEIREVSEYIDNFWRFPGTMADREQEQFVFVMPVYNMADCLEKAISSVAMQTATNWRMIIIDDCSDDMSVEVAQRAVERLGIEKRVLMRINPERRFALANVVAAVRECDGSEIICRLDGDDWLCDIDALSIINKVYGECKPDVLWTKNRFGVSGHNRSGPIPERESPYHYPWVSSHLRTFRKSLFDSVPDVNFRDEQGEYFQRTEDQALMLPLLHQSKKNMFLPIVAYHYSCERDEVVSPEARELQRSIATFIRERGFLSE